jgi:hypothetical protein
MRERLPNRRDNESGTIVWRFDDGPPVRVYCTAGFAEPGGVR